MQTKTKKLLGNFLDHVFLAALFFVVVHFLTACAALPHIGDVISGTANQTVTSGPLYKFRAELQLTVDGVKFDGMGATLMRPGEMIIDVESKFGLDRVQVTTCSRQDVFRDVDPDWFGGVGKVLHYHFIPDKQELSGQCPIYFEAFNKAGLAAWGFLVFRTDEALLAHVGCNGLMEKFAGASACQTLAGLKQTVSFDAPIKDYEAEPICGAEKADDLNFNFRPGSGICRATFYDGRWHSLIMFGYEKVLVQGE